MKEVRTEHFRSADRLCVFMNDNKIEKDDVVGVFVRDNERFVSSVRYEIIYYAK